MSRYALAPMNVLMLVGGVLGTCQEAPELDLLFEAAKMVDRCCL